MMNHLGSCRDRLRRSAAGGEQAAAVFPTTAGIAQIAIITRDAPGRKGAFSEPVSLKKQKATSACYGLVQTVSVVATLRATQLNHMLAATEPSAWHVHMATVF
jgi:hypothetical protein